MVKLKKYNGFLKPFVIFLTLFFITSCSQKNYNLTKIEGKQLPINEKGAETPSIEKFIKPYRDHINKDLDSVLAYCPETLDKSTGKWQTSIGNLLADVCVERGNIVFKSREKKTIDLCLLNHGGIRAILPKGNVTTRTAFEIMPFENNLVVIGLKGEQILEITSYIIKVQKAQPLSGMTFTIAKDNTAKNILIQGKPLDLNKVYYVATNDYLANGGDSMSFFAKGVEKFDLNYKLRNVLIDYFKQVDTIPVAKNIRITEE
ncbi:5'-nucleotidase C-terminal domain-containing protein [Flavobacterium psychroterrae]|uniref:5'-nucleotidase C-terminal domain-containing protein n=1 Tax=Flavobacterium psychroterrae TaxID=2133767 RepID=A0ABS5PEJ1_9FLAO|nr:5'-nucleotidase [Flavobacterium psychroterrae]MBS7232695.1 5'-nucleotidase C-terminal domain-containing protein [Flavobacterium psychroterrae]